MTKTTPPLPLPKKPQIIEWKLIDANVVIHAKEGGEKAVICQAVLQEANLATSDIVEEEMIRLIGDICKYKLKIFKVPEIEKKLLDTWIGDREKQASIPDKSLIQAAINDLTIIGIVTYDKDFIHMSAKGYIDMADRRYNHKRNQFWVLNAEQYLIKTGRIRKGLK